LLVQVGQLALLLVARRLLHPLISQFDQLARAREDLEEREANANINRVHKIDYWRVWQL
jgi:hypothetical protein